MAKQAKQIQKQGPLIKRQKRVCLCPHLHGNRAAQPLAFSASGLLLKAFVRLRRNFFVNFSCDLDIFKNRAILT